MFILTAKALLEVAQANSAAYDQPNNQYFVYASAYLKYTPKFVTGPHGDKVMNTANEVQTYEKKLKVVIRKEGLKELLGLKFDPHTRAFVSVKANKPIKTVKVDGIYRRVYRPDLKNTEEEVTVSNIWDRFKVTAFHTVETMVNSHNQPPVKQAPSKVDWQ